MAAAPTARRGSRPPAMNRSMARLQIALLVIGVVLIAQATMPRQAMGQCSGKYKGGLRPSPAELADILTKHAEWLKAGGLHDPRLTNDPRRANLCDADL